MRGIGKMREDPVEDLPSIDRTSVRVRPSGLADRSNGARVTHWWSLNAEGYEVEGSLGYRTSPCGEITAHYRTTALPAT